MPHSVINMSEYRVSTYDTNCNSYERLREALGGRGIRPPPSDYRYQPNDCIINWGSTGARDYPIHVNQPSAVNTSTHKLLSFQAFDRANVPYPIYTRDREVAKMWVADNHIVYARSTENGCRGQGIQVITPGSPMADNFPYALFYTKRFPGDREFRVYTMRDKVLQVYEKKDLDQKGLDPLVRASEDWYYCKENLAPYILNIEAYAIEATKAVGLDFSGVDVLVDSNTDDVCILEVNSAPWLGTGTAMKLANAIKSYFPIPMIDSREGISL